MNKQLNLIQKVIALPALLLIVVACGNKGKLYLPDANSYVAGTYTMQADEVKARQQRQGENDLYRQI